MKYSYKTETGEIRIINVLEGSITPFLPEGSELIGVVYDQLPSRYFRSIWKEENGQIKVDLAEARAFKMNKIREERDKYLLESDRDFAEQMSKVYANPTHGKKAMNEVAAIPEVKAILDRKEMLRDIPTDHQAALDAVESLEDIESYSVSFS